MENPNNVNEDDDTLFNNKYELFMSNKLMSPFDNRPLTMMEKLNIAIGDLLYVYYKTMDELDHETATSIYNVIFGNCTAPNVLENVTTAIAKTYMLLVKISNTFDVQMYERYKLYKSIFFDEVEYDEEKNTFSFVLKLVFKVDGGEKVSTPVKIKTIVRLRDTPIDLDFRPNDIEKRGNITSTVTFSNKFNIDCYVAGIKGCSSGDETIKPEELADDIIKDIGKANNRFMGMMISYLSHTGYEGLKDIRDSKCELCSRFGNTYSKCDPLRNMDIDDLNNENVTKDMIMNAFIDVFNYEYSNDSENTVNVVYDDKYEHECSLASWHNYTWKIIKGTPSDVYNIIYNNMNTEEMKASLAYILEDINKLKAEFDI